jgi:hypothetical protein
LLPQKEEVVELSKLLLMQQEELLQCSKILRTHEVQVVQELPWLLQEELPLH